jgi:hypothetical protein
LRFPTPRIRAAQETALAAAAVLQLCDLRFRGVQRLLKQERALNQQISGVGLLRKCARDHGVGFRVLLDAANLDKLQEKVLQKCAFLLSQ